MIEDMLQAVQDIFDGDTSAMSLLALGLCGSAIAFLTQHFRSVRGDVARRVTGVEAAGVKPDNLQSRAAQGGLTNLVGGFIGMLAQSIGQGDPDSARVLRSRLIQAGYIDPQAVIWFFGCRLGGALTFCALVAYGSTLWSPEAGYVSLAIFALVGAGLGFVAPTLALDKRINKLKREHSSGFPDFMDLMVVCAQAGLSMEASINRIAGEIGAAYPSLARNLQMTARELRSGKSLGKSIESLAGRLGIAEASSFSTLLQQSEELGSSLTQSLRTYSDDMRNKRLMKAEEKAYALPAKLVIPLTLFVFPVLLVVLLLPVVISVSSANM